jgi:hypothetical protein
MSNVPSIGPRGEWRFRWLLLVGRRLVGRVGPLSGAILDSHGGGVVAPADPKYRDDLLDPIVEPTRVTERALIPAGRRIHISHLSVIPHERLNSFSRFDLMPTSLSNEPAIGHLGGVL